MPWRTLFFALGVWALQQQAVVPAPTFLAAVALLGLAMLPLRRMGWLGALLLGCVWAGGFAHWRLADALPPDWEGRDVEVTGVVVDLPQTFERGVRFVLDVEDAGGPVPARIALSWYRQLPDDAEESGDEEGSPSALPLPKSGERWRLLVRLKCPHGSLNPHGFDVEGWWFERGIRAVGYVRKSALDRRLAAQAGGLAAMVGQWREGIRSRIDRTLDGHPYAGVVAALAIGDQQAIALVNDKTNFRWLFFYLSVFPVLALALVLGHRQIIFR